MFNICFDLKSERYIIPIYTEYNQLVGVKGRTVKNEGENNAKYLALYPYPRSEILYGLNHTFKYIKEKDMAIVVESEKAVKQLFSWKYCNSVGVGSKNISDIQIKKILQLNVPVCLALDKEVDIELLKKYIREFKKFTDVYLVYDKWNKLKNEKASPTDEGKEVWKFLFKNKFKY